MNQSMNNIEPVSEEEFGAAIMALDIKGKIPLRSLETPDTLDSALNSDRLAADLDNAMPPAAWDRDQQNTTTPGPEAKGRGHTPRSLN